MANLLPAQHAGSRTAIDFPSYVSGYFDGEGCFTVSISPRAKLTVGWEVRPSVSVSQNEDRSEVLQHLRAEGLIEIVRIVEGMNPSGKRRFKPSKIIDQLSEMKA